ncbi:hypothetical protein HY494_01825 [Candidatus Woesearchaeota archaeon]|nr:hypothetical protein [Candidatus Woesearchaeota archaeon]
MAGELVVGTRFEQMKVVEGWALRCYQLTVNRMNNEEINKEIIENLKKIDLQVRKLWTRDLQAHFRFITAKKIPAIPTRQKSGIFWKRGSHPSGGIPSEILGRRSGDIELSYKGMENKLAQIRAAAVVTLRDIKKDRKLSNSSKRTLRMLSSLATEVVKIWGKGSGLSF